jgi:hypothetical protein
MPGTGCFIFDRTVHFHDTIDTKGMTKNDVQRRDRVREIISAPVEAV